MIGPVLRSIRDRSGVSVREAAAALGVTPAAVYAWEASTRRMSVETIQALLAFYGAAPEDREAVGRMLVELEPAGIGERDASTPDAGPAA